MAFLRGTVAFIATLFAALAGLAVLAVAAAAYIFATNETGTTGTQHIAALEGEVRVLRDDDGIPHIFAETPADAYRALGFVHAQDRFFQMEFTRRTAAGRLSEIIGPLGLRTDRFMRTLGIYRLAKASVENLSPAARTAIDAYTQGVNAWITAPDRVRPAELIVLGVDPDPWRPADSAAWVRLMALLLSEDWRAEILRARLSDVLDEQQLRDLWPDEPVSATTTLTDNAGTGIDWQALADAVPDLFPTASASNEWVVAGSRSQSGKPLLANDPHLGLSAPGMWHLARIVTPDFTASGAALPGQPFFMVGQNGHMSWGLTTTHADVQDLFIERLDPADPDRYLTPEGSAAFETRDETIRVRFADPQTFSVRTTRHGPVVSDLSPDAAAVAGDGHVVALSFAALRDDDRTAEAAFRMNTATSVAEFRAALRDFHAPMQNVVYAHTDGSIGFVAAGRLPIRPGGPGIRPVPGWNGQHDWAGFVPFEELPQRQNPADGVIVNANNRVAPRSYPHVISNDWPPGFRAERITQLLDAAARHAPDSFAAIQTDVRSTGAVALVTAMAGTQPEPGPHQEIYERMTRWDGDKSPDRPEPLIYAAWSQALQARLIGDELGEMLSEFRGVQTRALIGMLTARQEWCDDTGTPQPESCADVITSSLNDAVSVLREAYGADPAQWRWGDAHRVTFVHPLLRATPGIAALLALHVSTGGGNHTINRGSYRASGDGRFPHIHGPGLRAIFDMSRPGEAMFMVAPGQSGRVASPSYANLAAPWAQGRYIVLKGDPDTLRTSATGELTLTP